MRKDKRYETVTNNRVTEINSFENDGLLNARRSNLDSDSEPHFLTQEVVDD